MPRLCGTDMRAPSPLWPGEGGDAPRNRQGVGGNPLAALTARVEAIETGWQLLGAWYEALLTGAEQNWACSRKSY